jgi:dienelactone hydrolase
MMSTDNRQRRSPCQVYRRCRGSTHMRRGLLACAIALTAFVVTAGSTAIQAQPGDAAGHAKRVIDLLRAERFEDVAKEFNAQMAAALPASQLRDVWSTLRQQIGSFTSFIDQRVTTPAAGTTAVVLGCQFEKAALNAIVAFDAEQRIAGLRFVPRPAASQEPPSTPTSSRFKEEAVTVGAGEWALPGTLSIPVGQITAGVVLVHGSGPNDRDETLGPNKPFRDIAWGLADRGMAVLRYEKRTRRYAGKMAGNKTLTVREETIDDSLLAAALLRARKEIDPKRIFVLGHSLGGTLAPRIAVEDPALAGIIILAGATRPLQDVAREQLTYLASLTPGSPDPEQGLQMLLRAAPDSYWKDLETYKPAQVAATIRLPMLILQGERDYQVTSADLQGWRDALEGRADVTIKSYPTLNHLFMQGEGKATPAEYERPGKVAEFVLDDIANWIGKTSPDRR